MIETGGKYYSHFYSSLFESYSRLLLIKDYLFNFKIPACFYLADDLLRCYILCIVYHYYLGILYFITKSKAEYQYLHDRHAKQDEQCLPVSQYMSKFLLYKND